MLFAAPSCWEKPPAFLTPSWEPLNPASLLPGGSAPTDVVTRIASQVLSLLGCLMPAASPCPCGRQRTAELGPGAGSSKVPRSGQLSQCPHAAHVPTTPNTFQGLAALPHRWQSPLPASCPRDGALPLPLPLAPGEDEQRGAGWRQSPGCRTAAARSLPCSAPHGRRLPPVAGLEWEEERGGWSWRGASRAQRRRKSTAAAAVPSERHGAPRGWAWLVGLESGGTRVGAA